MVAVEADWLLDFPAFLPSFSGWLPFGRKECREAVEGIVEAIGVPSFGAILHNLRKPLKVSDLPDDAFGFNAQITWRKSPRSGDAKDP